jgi:DNA-binding NarL/FixJ family response regulator
MQPIRRKSSSQRRRARAGTGRVRSGIAQKEGAMSIRVLLADDHKLLRQGLRTLLEEEPDITVVGEASNGRMARNLVRRLRPDVILMDVAMPDLNGIEAARQIRGLLPATRLLALSMHADKRFVAGMLKAGAAGYLLKDCDRSELLSAIRSVFAGGTYLSPEVAGSIVESYVRSPRQDEPQASPDIVLSVREREILQLVSEGLSTKQIATRLGVSVKTVETHRKRVGQKLGLHSTAELTKYAIREGMTSLDG